MVQIQPKKDNDQQLTLWNPNIDIRITSYIPIMISPLV